MKKTINNIKLIVLAMILALGMSYLGASADWVGPGTTPPGGNRATPVNVLSSDQIKEGSLGVGFEGVGGLDFDAYKLRVDGSGMSKGIYSEGDFTIADSAFVGTLGDGVDRSVSVGGRIAVGDTSASESLLIELQSGTIRSEAFPSAKVGMLGERKLCADSDGNIVVCENLAQIIEGLFAPTPGPTYCTVDIVFTGSDPEDGVAPYTYDWALSGDTAGNTLVGSTTDESVTVRADIYPLPYTVTVFVEVTDFFGDTFYGSATASGSTFLGTGDCD